MQFQVGQKVRVKTLKEALDTYGSSEYHKIDMPFGYVGRTMDDWLGKIVTILYVGTDSVHLEEDRYTWAMGMFKPVSALSFKTLY